VADQRSSAGTTVEERAASLPPTPAVDQVPSDDTSGPAGGGVDTPDDRIHVSEILGDAELKELETRQDSFDAQRSVVQDRDYFQESYLNPDGTSTVVMSTEVMNVPDESGAWVRPDDALDVGSGSVTTVRANPIEPHFQPRADAQGFLRIGRGRETVDFSLVDAAPSQIVRGDGTVTYPGVFPGVDLLYTVTAGGLQKEFRLARAPEAGEAQWTFRLSSRGLEPRLTDDGSDRIEFVDAEGTVVMSTPSPLMHDSSGDGAQIPAEAPVEIDLAREGRDWLLTVLPDEGWLTAPERVYPVYVDPTVEIDNDNDLTDGSGYNVVGMSENGRVVYDQGIRVGHCPSTCPNDAADPRRYTTWRSAVHFPYEEFFGYQVRDASFQYINVGSLASTSAGSGLVHHATGFQYGALGTTVANYSVAAGASSFLIPRNDQLLPTLQKWLDTRTVGAYFMFRFSEDYGQYTYRTGYAKMFMTLDPPRTGVQSYDTVLSEQLSDRQSIGVNVGTGNLTVEATDLRMAGTGQDTVVTRTYNSLAAHYGVYGDAVVDGDRGGAGRFGPGWVSSATGDMRLTPIDGTGTSGFAGASMSLTDGSGSRLTFSKVGTGTDATNPGLSRTVDGYGRVVT
jgi:hypothetical protein